MTLSPTDLTRSERRREQRSWGFYDWANSAYATTVAAVFLGPYLTSIASRAACPGGTGVCQGRLDLFGISIAPGSYFSYTFAFSIVIQIFFVPWLGALADRSTNKKFLLALFAYMGATATVLMFFIVDGRWLFGGILYVIGNLCFSASMVVYNSFLPQITEPDERDEVSNKGWALGYLGGGLLLLINLVLYSLHESFGLTAEESVRLSLVSAGVWWAFFTTIPLRGLRNRAPMVGSTESSTVQLLHTLRQMRAYPMTLLFLVAYLLYNDGIQSVLAMASIYGSQELLLDQNVLISAILLVQFVAFFGNLFLLALSKRFGPKETIIGSLVVWTALTTCGYFIAPGDQVAFYLLAIGFGLVMGGSQALSRSLFAQMIPKGSEAQYYSVYELSERGTSWLGALAFGLVNQFTGSYRLALLSLIVFFVAGLLLLLKVDVRRAIADVGNEQPAKV
jgi:MFS transporter, UMF1 family